MRDGKGELDEETGLAGWTSAALAHTIPGDDLGATHVRSQVCLAVYRGRTTCVTFPRRRTFGIVTGSA